MGRAALRLGMAQPPLSQSIARLETELGVRLFARGGRKLSLTRAGAAMLEDARSALAHAKRAEDNARGSLAGTSGELRVGFVSAALYHHLPILLRRLCEKYPDITPRLFEMSTNEQLAALDRQDIDMGFVHPPLGRAHIFDVTDLPEDELIAAIPDRGPAQMATLAELAACGLILFPESQGPSLRAEIIDAFVRENLRVDIRQEASRALTMLALVSAGIGAALLPKSTAQLNFKGVRFVRIAASNKLPRFQLSVIARARPRWPVIDTALSLVKNETI